MLELRQEIVRLQRNELIRQAEQHRLTTFVTAYQPGTARRILAWTGRRLVTLGEGLQGRATAPAPVILHTEVCC